MESEFPSNSRKSARPVEREEAKRTVERVTTSEVVRRKKPLSRRMSETFIGGDAKSVWGYVFLDVLVPAAKDMVADAGSQFIERMMFGDSRSSSRRRSRSDNSVGHVAYNRFASSSREEPRRDISRRARTSHDFDEIIIASRADAEEVLDHLIEMIAKYETASVGDLYELVGISGNFTDAKWGWTDLRGSGVMRTRNGYLLNLPKPEPID